MVTSSISPVRPECNENSPKRILELRGEHKEPACAMILPTHAGPKQLLCFRVLRKSGPKHSLAVTKGHDSGAANLISSVWNAAPSSFCEGFAPLASNGTPGQGAGSLSHQHRRDVIHLPIPELVARKSRLRGKMIGIIERVRNVHAFPGRHSALLFDFLALRSWKGDLPLLLHRSICRFRFCRSGSNSGSRL
jgi:hypothetical protein